MAAPRHSWIAEVRERLASPPPRRSAFARPGQPGGAGDRAEAREAAVLVPLYVTAGELWTVLTRRSDDLPSHRGQYAFPGGSREAGEDPWATALREAGEEVGILPETVLRLGELDEEEVPTGFRVVPCVGAIPAPSSEPGGRGEPRAASAEIAEVFSLPLSAFASPRLVEDRDVTYDGERRRLRIYHVGSRQIWGLTAHVLQNLLSRLGLDAGAGP